MNTTGSLSLRKPAPAHLWDFSSSRWDQRRAPGRTVLKSGDRTRKDRQREGRRFRLKRSAAPSLALEKAGVASMERTDPVWLSLVIVVKCI